MYSYDRRTVTASIKQITKAYIRTYSDSGDEKAYIEWIDDKGKPGRTEGKADGAHMKALLDRAKREKVKVETQKWASWKECEAARRNDWISEQKILSAQDLRADSNISNSAWERGIATLLDNVTSMKSQVDRFGGIVNALERGHGTTLKQQMTETTSILRVLQRRLGD